MLLLSGIQQSQQRAVITHTASQVFLINSNCPQKGHDYQQLLQPWRKLGRQLVLLHQSINDAGVGLGTAALVAGIDAASNGL